MVHFFYLKYQKHLHTSYTEIVDINFFPNKKTSKKYSLILFMRLRKGIIILIDYIFWCFQWIFILQLIPIFLLLVCHPSIYQTDFHYMVQTSINQFFVFFKGFLPLFVWAFQKYNHTDHSSKLILQVVLILSNVNISGSYGVVIYLLSVVIWNKMLFIK